MGLVVTLLLCYELCYCFLLLSRASIVPYFLIKTFKMVFFFQFGFWVSDNLKIFDLQIKSFFLLKRVEVWTEGVTVKSWCCCLWLQYLLHSQHVWFHGVSIKSLSRELQLLLELYPTSESRAACKNICYYSCYGDQLLPTLSISREKAKMAFISVCSSRMMGIVVRGRDYNPNG